jgi:hypothetical protein
MDVCIAGIIESEIRRIEEREASFISGIEEGYSPGRGEEKTTDY